MKLRKKALTLLEVLLTVSALAVIAGLSIVPYRRFQMQNNLGLSEQYLVTALRRAQMLSQSGREDSAWGMAYDTGDLIIFKGDDFASRDVDFDEVIDLPGNIFYAGLSEVVFEKHTGLPASTGSITLSNLSSDSTVFTLESQGQIAY